ncbi:TetR family transcriptional regulator [Glutamicibacter sp. NPDC087344]|uniref:TetR family transcriptional regulator n=1 Tax=Glutamicibacter sp. NPDC087344 TaxID=3363994 RepID=UPI00380CDE0B
MAGALGERVRAKMKVELAERLYNLFVERGLENVTAEQAARAVGISRATFFRYFASKEDAVVTALRSFSAQISQLPDDLASRPGESLLEVLRRSFDSTVQSAEQEPELLRQRIRFIWENPNLRARWLNSRLEQQAELAQALAPFCENARQLDTSALIALALYDRCLVRWLESPAESLRELLDEAFDHAAMIDASWSSTRVQI